MRGAGAKKMSLVNSVSPAITVRELFASPIAIFEWPEASQLNSALRNAILERYASLPSKVQSGRYAWQSDHRLHEWPEACIAEFNRMMTHAAGKFAAHLAPGGDRSRSEDWEIVSCWANVNPRGGYTASHNHDDTGGVLSGVYYVDIGECDTPSHAGRTIFEDHSGAPRPVSQSADMLSNEYALVPRPGRMAIFTSTQYHYVEPNRGSGLRITVAFNLRHHAFRILTYERDAERGWWWRNFRGLMVMRRKFPEKLRAIPLFASYLARELKGGGPSGVPWSRRFQSALQRAEVDTAARVDPIHAAADAGRPPPEKRQLL
jgi:uncharacterized protein (TIGR02466 family)